MKKTIPFSVNILIVPIPFAAYFYYDFYDIWMYQKLSKEWPVLLHHVLVSQLFTHLSDKAQVDNKTRPCIQTVLSWCTNNGYFLLQKRLSIIDITGNVVFQDILRHLIKVRFD